MRKKKKNKFSFDLDEMGITPALEAEGMDVDTIKELVNAPSERKRKKALRKLAEKKD